MPFFLFPFFIFFFLSFSFCRSPFSPSFSCCLFVLSFSVCFLYRLLLSFRFPTLLNGGFCYFVSVLNPPRAACEPASTRIPLACCTLSCVLPVYLLYFSSLPSLFRFRFGHRLFHPIFFLWVLCCLLGFGFRCDSFSI